MQPLDKEEVSTRLLEEGGSRIFFIKLKHFEGEFKVGICHVDSMSTAGVMTLSWYHRPAWSNKHEWTWATNPRFEPYKKGHYVSKTQEANVESLLPVPVETTGKCKLPSGTSIASSWLKLTKKCVEQLRRFCKVCRPDLIEGEEEDGEEEDGKEEDGEEEDSEEEDGKEEDGEEEDGEEEDGEEEDGEEEDGEEEDGEEEDGKDEDDEEEDGEVEEDEELGPGKELGGEELGGEEPGGEEPGGEEPGGEELGAMCEELGGEELGDEEAGMGRGDCEVEDEGGQPSSRQLDELPISQRLKRRPSKRWPVVSTPPESTPSLPIQHVKRTRKSANSTMK